jgi:hypothetical protein
VSKLALGATHPPNHWVTGAFSLWVKQLGHEADHSPPSSAEVKNAWSYTSTPPIHLHEIVLKSTGMTLPLPFNKNIIYMHARFEIFMVVKFQVKVFQVVMPCSFTIG